MLFSTSPVGPAYINLSPEWLQLTPFFTRIDQLYLGEKIGFFPAIKWLLELFFDAAVRIGYGDKDLITKGYIGENLS